MSSCPSRFCNDFDGKLCKRAFASKVECTNIITLTGHVLPSKEIKYLGIFIVQFRAFKCAIDDAKCSFYRAANAIFGKVGRRHGI